MPDFENRANQEQLTSTSRRSSKAGTRMASRGWWTICGRQIVPTSNDILSLLIYLGLVTTSLRLAA
jgi:hypothetical protein